MPPDTKIKRYGRRVQVEPGRAEFGGQAGLSRALTADDQLGRRVEPEQVRGDQRERAVADDPGAVMTSARRSAMPGPHGEGQAAEG